jgi:hypothetical protein
VRLEGLGQSKNPMTSSGIETDSIYFDFNNVFDIIPRGLPLHNRNNYAVPSG